MNQDEFYQRVREIATIEHDITGLQERLHTLYLEVAREANPANQGQTPATAAAN